MAMGGATLSTQKLLNAWLMELVDGETEAFALRNADLV